jgi:hypothetical protein
MLNVMAQFRTGSDDASVVAGRQNSDALQAVPCKAPRKGVRVNVHNTDISLAGEQLSLSPFENLLHH